MTIRSLTPALSVSPQIDPADVVALAASGFRSIVCNRPDGEDAGQPTAAAIAASAEAHGLRFVHIPVMSGGIDEGDVATMARALADLPAPVLAYCRSGARSEQLAGMASARGADGSVAHYDIIVIGGGSAGIATAASILRRRPGVSIAIVEPCADHYYQPGFTMVGGGIFAAEATRRDEAGLIPAGAEWVRGAAASFDPASDRVTLADGRVLGYRALIVCPGLKLDWDAIPGLAGALGADGVTSNYRYDLAPYTDRLVRRFRGGRALFTQPPMPIKCAGAPQKAMYLSCHRWERAGLLGQAEVQFHTATPSLFGVAAYVPALEAYIARYAVDLQLESRLVSIDGPAKVALFEQRRGDAVRRVEERFDMIMSSRRRSPPNLSHRARSRRPPASSRSTRRRSAIVCTPMSSRSGMSLQPPTPRPRPPRANRRLSWRSTRSPRSMALRQWQLMTVMGAAHSRSKQGRSSSPNSAMAGNCSRPFPNG